MDKPVIILGAGGVGKAAYEIFKSHKILIYCFLDDRKDLHGKTIDEISILGSTQDEGYLKLIGHKCEAFVATDDNEERKSLVKMLKERRKVIPVNAIHDNANLAPSAVISHGNFINDSVSIGFEAQIGSYNIFHAGAIVDYETKIGDFVQIGAGAIIGPQVILDDEVFIGAGAVVVPGISIGKQARIGAGSVVVEDIKGKSTVFGNPARQVDV